MDLPTTTESWVHVPDNCDFPLENLPFGVFSTKSLRPRIGVAIGNEVLDLKFLVEEGVLTSSPFDLGPLRQPKLNQYARLGKRAHSWVRAFLGRLLDQKTDLGSLLRDNVSRRRQALHSLDDVKMHLPMDIGNFTDFFAGKYHAQNCVEIFRPGQGLNPNYYHLPTAYHGRASSVVVSGTPVRRPMGQYLVDDVPTYGPTRMLDFEIEFAAFIGAENSLGQAISVDTAEDHIFGVVILNDWSARDIQRWESPSLGPFNGKNFCTTISPWVVSLEALATHRVPKIPTDVALLPYLDEARAKTAFDIRLEARLTTNDSDEEYTLTRTNTRYVIFSFAQMIAHHTVGGCPLKTGDLISTGTISGPLPEEAASMLELSVGGSRVIQMTREDRDCRKPAPRRTFLEDGDELTIIRGDSEGRIGFGVCRGRIIGSE